jgi:uncharacterized protein YycO
MLATLALYFGLLTEAHAHDCVARLLNVTEMVKLPRHVMEDCMRTGWTQAIVTAVIALICGGWIRQKLSTAGQPPELPGLNRADVKKRVGEMKPHDFEEGVKGRIDKALDDLSNEVKKYRGMPDGPDKEKTRVRLAATIWALSQFVGKPEAYKENETSPHLWESVSETSGKDRAFKCNKLVADAFAHGAGIGLSLKPGEVGFPIVRPPHGKETAVWAPLADDFATVGQNLRNFTMARPMDMTRTKGVAPDIGDLIAVPNTEPNTGGVVHSGHVGIYIGNGLMVAAKKVPGVTIESVDWENKNHKHKAIVRSYTGSGK